MVKRVGNLMPRIASLENLHEAFLRAAKGKAGKREVMAFRSELDERLLLMQRQLLEGSYKFGHYHFFTIHDPKKRTICAATFADRVVFHAMMRICHPVFDGYQVFDSYASRVGKGSYKALYRAAYLAHHYKWFAKIDACKYFDSVSHQILLGQLARLFKDSQLLIYFSNLLNTYCTVEGRGLPIGNLTSQYFANHYLAVADHYLKEQLHVPAMVRYMDDVLLMAHSKDELIGWVMSYRKYMEDRLQLEIHNPVVNQSKFGIPFLGYVVYGNGLRLNRRSKMRFEQKMAALTATTYSRCMDEKEYASRATCMMAFIDKADVVGFKQQMYNKRGVYLHGL